MYIAFRTSSCYQSKIILVMRYETRYPLIFAELSSKFYLLLGEASAVTLKKEMNFQSFQLLMCVLMDVIFLMALQESDKRGNDNL